MIWFCKHLARTEDLLAPPFEQPERSQPQGRTQGDSLAVWVCKGRCSDFFAGGWFLSIDFNSFKRPTVRIHCASSPHDISPDQWLSFDLFLGPCDVWLKPLEKKHHTPYIGPYIMTQSCLITGRRRWVYLILDLRCFCGQ